MLKYIFSVLLIAAVWTTVLLLELPLWIAIVSTVVILVILLTIVIYRVVKAKRAAKEIERALQAQADQHASRARPDMQADIEAMKSEFMKAVGALKTSKLGGKSAAEALYALPWYMIIGPPGSGKSTALRNSGLRFPYLSKSGGGVQGVGGTRNCQWWMTNDAVILDTAGRYTTEDSDHDEWLAFLDLLKRNRTKAPVNGVMVAIAITDLSEAHPESVVAQAREIRSRVDEVMNKLEMVVPVYVLFTKCDLLPGFVETFGDLGNNERSQIWGFTFPVTKKIRDPMNAFAEHFSELAAVTERRAIRRMSEERSIEGRDKIYAFPQYFEPMRDTLAMFTGELFAENIYNESPIMRGCYFTSGTQEGRPIDRIMNSMAEAFGIQPRMQMSYQPQNVEAKSYFLGQLFTKVIFPDKYLAGRSASRIRRQKLAGHGAGLGLLTVAGGVAVLPVNSFNDNRDLLSETGDAVAKVNEHYAQKEESSSNIDPIRIENIQPLRRVERKLAEYEEEGPPFFSRMGMYQGATVYPPVRDLYFTAVREELLVPIRDMEIRELKRFKHEYSALSEPAPGEEHAANKDRLRMYLLITTPADGRPETEPGLTEDEQVWLTERIATLWEKPLEIAGDVAEKGEMREVARAYVSILATDSGRLFERDEGLVKDIRKILMRTDRTQALLDQILGEVDAPELDLKGLTNTRGALKNDDKKVKGAYTRAAWDDYLRDRLYTPLGDLMGDEWVLGISEEDMKKDREKQLEQLRSLYFDQYIQEWRQFINAIYVEQPDNYANALSTLEDLTRSDPASFARLCQNLTYHTNLPPPEPEATDEAAAGLMDVAGAEATKALQKKGKAGRVGAEAMRRKNAKRKAEAGVSLLKDEYSVAAAFEGLAGFGFVAPPPAPEGGAPPPAPEAPIDAYLEALRELRVALKSKVQNDTDEDTKALISAVKSAGDTVDSLINDSDTKGWGPTLDKWLRPPVRSLESIARRGAGADLTKAWCDEVVRPWSKLAKRYPFSKKGKEVPLADFAEFYKPETGTVWTFYSSLLSGRVPRRHEGYTIETKGARVANSINPKVATFLNRAQDVTTVMFPPGSDGVSFEFDVQVQGARKAPDVRRTLMSIDGQEVDYQNGPYQWNAMTWPGEEPQSRISASGFGTKGDVGPFEGEWGFFRLLEAGTNTGDSGKDTFKFEWDIRDQDSGIITVLLRPKLDDTPIYGRQERGVEFMQVFRHPDLAPPRQVIVGGPSCGKK